MTTCAPLLDDSAFIGTFCSDIIPTAEEGESSFIRENYFPTVNVNYLIVEEETYQHNSETLKEYISELVFLKNKTSDISLEQTSQGLPIGYFTLLRTGTEYVILSEEFNVPLNGTKGDERPFLLLLIFERRLISDKIDSLESDFNHLMRVGFILPFSLLCLFFIVLNSAVQYKIAIMITTPIVILYEKIQVLL